MAAFLYFVLITAFASSVNCQMVPYPNQYQYPYQQPYQQPAYGVETNRYISPYYARTYRMAQDFFATSRQDLDRKVQDALLLLEDIRRNQNELSIEARNRGDTILQNSLFRIDAAYQDVANFQRQLSMDRVTPFQQLEADWQNRITALYDNGLYSIMRSAEMWGGGICTRASAFFVFLLSVIVLIAGFI